jgi:uncharacterized membrane protein
MSKRFQFSNNFKGILSLSILCICFVLIRIGLRGDIKYTFLVWNLILAWVPYIVSIFLNTFKDFGKNYLFRYSLLVFWLLFFPNSPYIITDFLHLKGYSQNIIWFDSLLIFLFALTGLILSLKSLETIHNYINNIFGNFYSWFVVLFSIILSGFGIYLGRYCRLNSWNLFSDPIWLLQRIVHQFENPLSYQVTITFSFFILSVYIIYRNFLMTK